MPILSALAGLGVALAMIGLFYLGAWIMLALARWLDRQRFGGG